MRIQDELHALRNARRLMGPDWNRRIRAAAQLGDAGAVDAIPDLESVVMENNHPDLVREAIRAISQIQAEPAYASLGRIIANNPDEICKTLCVDALLKARKKGSAAAALVLTLQWDHIFPILLNRARQQDGLARLTLVQMGELAINALIEALPEPATQEVAASVLIDFGQAAEKPLLQALGKANDENSPLILNALLRASGKSRQALLDEYCNERKIAIKSLQFRHGEDWRSSLPVFKSFERLDPESAESHYWLAVAYGEMNDLPNAEKHFRRVLDASHRERLPTEFVANAHRWLVWRDAETKGFGPGPQL
jgi:HEAT repeat protein